MILTIGANYLIEYEGDREKISYKSRIVSYNGAEVINHLTLDNKEGCKPDSRQTIGKKRYGRFHKRQGNCRTGNTDKSSL